MGRFKIYRERNSKTKSKKKENQGNVFKRKKGINTFTNQKQIDKIF